MPDQRIAIVTDSTADLPADLRRQFGVTVIPVGLRFGNETFADGVDIDADAFLARMQAGGPPPSTVAPSAEQFAAVFRDRAANHDGIVAVVGSAKLGRTMNSALAARDEVSGIIPVEVVDSRSATMGLGWQTIRAAELAAADAGLHEIADLLRAETARYEVVFFVDTLEHLRRGGRIGRAAALIGQALDLKPLLRIDEGQVVPLDRARSHARAVDALVDAVAAMGAVERVAALYATSEQEGRVLADRLASELGLAHDRVLAARIGPGVATHIGPGGLGVAVVDVPG